MITGKEIQNLRKRKGLTQEELAAEIGVSRSAIYAWEKGMYSPEGKNAVSLARVLEIDVRLLIDGELPKEELKRNTPTLYEMMADGILQPVKDQHRLAFDEFLKTNPDIELWFRQIQRERVTEEELEKLKKLIIEWIRKGNQ